MTAHQSVLGWLHDNGPWSGMCTRDFDIVVARDSAVPIMAGTPNVVGLLINLCAVYFHLYIHDNM